ncbi:MAG: hypothetical protein ACK4EX_05915 [Thermaurantimonas sp.]|uniref:hypothetical protein n=1 Tax=Thermaurantimonas sp. TaxID=2681568 RepID=UPI00391CB081
MKLKIEEKYIIFAQKAYSALRTPIINSAIKYAVIIVCFFILFQRLSKSDFKPEFLFYQATFLQIIPIFILLSLANFFLDVLLWSFISKGSHKLRFWHYARHHLISLSLGFITPNNIGEYGGKMRQFEAPLAKLKGFFLAFHFRTVKTVARNIIGFFATYLLFYTTDSFLKEWHLYLFFFVVFIHLLFYWNIENFLPLLTNISIRGKNYFQSFLRIRISSFEKIKWISLSAVKFFIYTSQLSIVLLSIGSSGAHFFTIWLYVAFYYSLAAYLPTILVFDPIVKGAVGIFLLKQLHLSDWSIFTSVTLVWTTNVALPALVGSFLWAGRKRLN